MRSRELTSDCFPTDMRENRDQTSEEKMMRLVQRLTFPSGADTETDVQHDQSFLFPNINVSFFLKGVVSCFAVSRCKRGICLPLR